MFSHPIYSKEGGWPLLLREILKKKTNKFLPEFTKEEIELIKGTFIISKIVVFTSRGAFQGSSRIARENGVSNSTLFRLVDYHQFIHTCPLLPIFLSQCLLRPISLILCFRMSTEDILCLFYRLLFLYKCFCHSLIIQSTWPNEDVLLHFHRDILSSYF